MDSSEIPTIEAACALIVRPWDGRILTVSRRHDPKAKGLPGGKKEARDKTLLVTAGRELNEETGLVMRPDTAVMLYDAPCADIVKGTVSRSVTYYVPHWTGTPASTPEGMVEWSTWEEVVFGPFGAYNAELAKRYREHMRQRGRTVVTR